MRIKPSNAGYFLLPLRAIASSVVSALQSGIRAYASVPPVSRNTGAGTTSELSEYGKLVD